MSDISDKIVTSTTQTQTVNYFVKVLIKIKYLNHSLLSGHIALSWEGGKEENEK